MYVSIYAIYNQGKKSCNMIIQQSDIKYNKSKIFFEAF